MVDLFQATQQEKVTCDLQALVDAQFSLAGGAGVFCISEPVHTEWNKTASQNKSGKDGSRRQELHSLINAGTRTAHSPAEEKAGTGQVRE